MEEDARAILLTIFYMIIAGVIIVSIYYLVLMLVPLTIIAVVGLIVYSVVYDDSEPPADNKQMFT